MFLDYIFLNIVLEGRKDIKTIKLKNGLKIVAYEMPYLRSISIGIGINAGSRIENEKNSGVAHFIEHMLFKGTENYTAKEIANKIDYYGGNINGYTNHDCTVFYVKIEENRADVAVDVLSEMICRPKFLKEDIKNEKNVILEELKMYEDSPEDYLYETLLEKTFDGKGIGRNTLGSIKSLEKMNQKKILDFYKKYYIPENAVISITGKFDFEKLTKIIEEKFGIWESENKESDFKIKRENQTFKPAVLNVERDIEQVNLAIIYETPSDKVQSEFLAIKLLGNIMGNTPSSRLFQKIREDNGLAYSVYTADNFYKDYGEFGIYASMTRENAEIVIHMIKEEIEHIKNNYISVEELKFAKEQMKGSFLIDFEDPEDIMTLMLEATLEGKKVKTTEAVIKSIDAITIDNMKFIIDKIFGLNKASYGIIGKDVKNALTCK